jgi:hypothetical protein
MYTLICEEFVSFGGVYVKFLQGVMLRSEMMRRWKSDNKLRIFEDLDSEPLDIAKIMQRELGPEKLKQIALVQPVPFAAGSFGQVYYGQMRDGTQVIIKILRPMISELLRYDLKLLTIFSKYFFMKLYKNIDMNLDQAFLDFKNATLRETDYIHEAEFANELYEYYTDNDTMFIPKTYLELCTKNIIVQEYVDGLSLAHVVKMHEKGVDPQDYVREQTGSDLALQLETFGYENIMAIFKSPRIQGDPHPGNIRLLHDNKVGLIDFGISANSPEEKAAFFGMLDSYDQIFKGSHTIIDLFEQGLRFFVSDLYLALNKIGKFIDSNSNANYSREVSQVAEDVYVELTGSENVEHAEGNEENIMMTVNKLVNKGNRFGLIMKLESTEILRAVQTFSTLVTSLGLYDTVMPKIIHRVVRDVKIMHPEAIVENDDAIQLRQAVDIVTTWLERVAIKDPKLFEQLSKKIRLSTTPKKNDMVAEDG